jgi:hypothetical protein
MAWAVQRETGSIVHVSMLWKAQNGLQCGCVCPSCHSPLQAVNIDKDASHFAKPNTLGQFFRHTVGQPTHKCAIVAARLAALQLLVECDEILLPAPARRVEIRGASGKVYIGWSSGKPVQTRIRHRVWVDNQTARLTLKVGQVIQIQLTGIREVSAHGMVDGIIEIRIDDPEVASWSREQILARATLDGDSSCWLRHWDDEALTAAARRDAEAQAAEHSDFVPPELARLVGLSQSLLSESVLHWVVKELLAEAQSVRTPSHDQEVTSTYASGMGVRREMLHWPAETLALSKARLEQRVDNIIPDVRCWARDAAGHAFDLFVEVVVTNPVSPQKLARVRALGSACLVVDLRKLNISGTVRREVLRKEVLHDIGHKTWLHHPLIDARRQETLQRLNAHMRRQEALLRQAEMRKDNLQSMPPATLLRELAVTLHRDWLDLPPLTGAWTTVELTTSLTKRGISGSEDPFLLKKQGLLWHLEAIRFAGSPRKRITHEAPADLFLVAMRHPALRQFTTLLVWAIRAYRSPTSAQQCTVLREAFATVRASIDRGEMTYARPSTYDALVSAMYPPLADSIAQLDGTVQHANKLQLELLKKQQQEAKARQEAVEQQKRIEIEKALQLAAESAERNYRAAFAALSGQAWNPDRGMTRYSEQAQKNVRYLRTQAKGASAVDKFALVKSAWQAREDGLPFPDWLARQELKTAGQLQACAEILEAACLKLGDISVS